MHITNKRAYVVSFFIFIDSFLIRDAVGQEKNAYGRYKNALPTPNSNHLTKKTAISSFQILDVVKTKKNHQAQLVIGLKSSHPMQL